LGKTAQISSVHASNPHGFQWVWRSIDGNQQSPKMFAYFYDCVEDARRAGFTVNLPGRFRKALSGGYGHGLR
jgi:hypothetical protein